MRFSILFLFTLSIAYGQTLKSEKPEFIYLDATPENFRLAMSIENPTPKQVDTIIQVSIEYSYTSEDTCFIVGQRAVDVSEENSDKKARALLELGDSYRIFGDLEKGEELILRGRAIYESLTFPGEVAYADLKLGALSVNRADFEAGIKYYLNALEIWENLHDSENIIKPLINIGSVFKRMNRFDKAEEYYGKSLVWAELINDDRAKMYARNNQAIIYNIKANEYQKKAESDSTRIQIFSDSAQFWIQQSLSHYELSLELAMKLKDKQSEARFFNNMIELKITTDSYQEAIELGKKAEILFKDLKVSKSIVNNKINLAKAYFHNGNLNEAIFFGKEGLRLAMENEFDEEKAKSDKMLFEIYRELEDFEKALTHYESYTGFMSDTNDKDKIKAIAEVEEKYQNVKKEKQIIELEFENEKITKQRNYFIGGGFFIAILSLLGFQFNKIRKDRNDKIAFAEALIFAQENERKRIARDLHDGVGQSLLLIKKQMEATFETTLENQEMIAETLEEVRSISQDLHPFQLEKFGLTAAIHETIQKVSNSTDIFITKDLENIDEFIPKENQIHIFRTIQEALNNVVKHSEASAAKISIKVEGNEVTIRIQDNGKGFDHELAIVKSKSLGLKTMFERIAAISGKLTVEPGTKNGTIIKIVINKSR